VALGIRPSEFLDIEDPTLALLWDLEILRAAEPPKSTKEKIKQRWSSLGIRSYRV